MVTLVDELAKLAPDITFQPGSSFFWSPKKRYITYDPEPTEHNTWALLHETAHATLDHSTYNSDFELLHLEVAAWEEAKILARRFSITIDENHVQDCLDTYRDWLHQRSTCPTCSSVSFQNAPNEYRCHNCHTSWQVSTSRFCRPYRLRNSKQSKKSPGVNPQTTFA